MVHILLFILALAVLFTAAPSGLVNKMNAQPLATWADSVIDGPISTWRIDDAQQEYGKTQNAHTQSKRQTFSSCKQKGDQPALVSDATACIQELAARGAQGQFCDVSSTAKSQCRRRFAQIVTVNPYPNMGPASMHCNDIARAVTLILDRCTRDGLTVTGQSNINSIAIHLQEPLILQSLD
jgi:hypothetical protein